MPTLRLADCLREDLVLWDLPCTDKASLLTALAVEVALRVPEVDEQDLTERLLEREGEQTTGVGGGLAVPHATLAGLERPLLVVGRTHERMEFDAVDAQPIDVVFLLLTPPAATRQHLRLLARLARIFAPEEMLERLRAAKGPKELFEILVDEDGRHV